jgi:hydroxymethylbilane synthase
VIAGEDGAAIAARPKQRTTGGGRRPAVPLRLGTRGSPLALRQCALVAAAIDARVETVVLRTGGDRGEEGDKRRWVDTIESALLDGSIDLAVHSAKDLPGELSAGLEIAGAPVREDARDALCGAARSLAELPAGARVGTSSLRRRSQLLALREDLVVAPLHGNLGTRLARLQAGEFDAIVLAAAGLRRLALTGWHACEELVPAAGQGTLALQARTGDTRVAEAIVALRDPPTEAALTAERAAVRRLGAGCDTPIGVHARAERDGRLEVRAHVGAPDGQEWIRDRMSGPATDAAALGEAVAERLLRAGAGELLA